jgi:hypothetical protein
LAEDAAKRRLSDQRTRADEIDRFHDGVTWTHDSEVDDGIHLNRDIVTCDGFLGRDFQCDDAEVHLAHGFDKRDQKEDAGPRTSTRRPRRKITPVFVLLHDFDRGGDDQQQNDGEDAKYDECCHSDSPFVPHGTAQLNTAPRRARIGSARFA